jgi:hypothetical protein
MVNSGVDLFTVGKVLGHANVASTPCHTHLANDTLTPRLVRKAGTDLIVFRRVCRVLGWKADVTGLNSVHLQARCSASRRA